MSRTDRGWYRAVTPVGVAGAGLAVAMAGLGLLRLRLSER